MIKNKINFILDNDDNNDRNSDLSLIRVEHWSFQVSPFLLYNV